MIRALAIFLFLFSTQAMAVNVLLVHSYHKENEWDNSFAAVIQNQLDSKANLYQFELDTKRIDEGLYAQQAQKALEFYHEVKPLIVILSDDNAFDYMMPLLQDQDISIVFMGVNKNPRKALSDHTGLARVTGVLERPLLVRNIIEMSHVIGKEPFLVKVMLDGGATAKIIEKDLRESCKHFHGKIILDIVHHDTFSGWKEEVLSSSSYDAIFLGLYQRVKDNNQPVSEKEVMQWTNLNAPKPLFGFWDFTVGKGRAAGGLVVSGPEQGMRAVSYVNRIIAGESALYLPLVYGGQGKHVCSLSEFARWGMKVPEHCQLGE
ncbi:ABC transporter substrate-binding protein [Salinivibrio sp. PR5]|uniref:ABC transporter substrate-binding protein n=1 Tax=Salinivibrio sp. PR5 TaxID=1909484 RepID=UPI000989C752|nr:hypothetical protein [Salinivibrio sp. PR5]